MTENEYRMFVARERRAGLKAVGEQLDQMCVDLGLEPWEAWRRPRQEERRERTRQAMRNLSVSINRSVEAMKAAFGVG